jgi:hypothetical protein
MAYPFHGCGLHVDIRPSYTITRAPVDRTLRFSPRAKRARLDPAVERESHTPQPIAQPVRQ